jgi:hypothetical protein
VSSNDIVAYRSFRWGDGQDLAVDGARGAEEERGGRGEGTSEPSSRRLKTCRPVEWSCYIYIYI